MTTTEAPGPQNVDDAVTIEGSDRSLSKDCLFECLLFVPHYALSRTAILVCKQWHALYESPEFRKAREIIDDDAQRCPVCLKAWNVNVLTRPLEAGASYDQTKTVRECCCKYTCYACYRKARRCTCPLCRRGRRPQGARPAPRPDARDRARRATARPTPLARS